MAEIAERVARLEEKDRSHEYRLNMLEKQQALRKATCPYRDSITTLDSRIERAINTAFDKMWIKVYGYMFGTVIMGIVMAAIVAWLKSKIN